MSEAHRFKKTLKKLGYSWSNKKIRKFLKNDKKHPLSGQ